MSDKDTYIYRVFHGDGILEVSRERLSIFCGNLKCSGVAKSVGRNTNFWFSNETTSFKFL